MEYRAAVIAIARPQRGVIARAQLLDDVGCSPSWVSARVRDGFLRRVLPGVYAVGAAELTREAMWRAAVMTGGENATLSHRSAGVQWGLLRRDGPGPEITVTGARGRTAPAVIVHRCRLAEEDVVLAETMRTTRPMRTVLDLAEQLPRAELAEVVNQAMLRGLFDRDELAEAVVRGVGRAGLAPLRAVIAATGSEPLDVRSAPEWLARDILIAAGVGKPEMNAAIALGDGRYRYADLYFRDVRLDLEIDGPHHRLAHIAARDARRTADLRPRGVSVMRRWDSDLDDAPRFAADVAAELARLRGCGD